MGGYCGVQFNSLIGSDPWVECRLFESLGNKVLQYLYIMYHSERL